MSVDRRLGVNYRGIDFVSQAESFVEFSEHIQLYFLCKMGHFRVYFNECSQTISQGPRSVLAYIWTTY